ncbi:hypothetical protein K440DRAFT_643414 [Wilcoxina mikolae CBS 423.85]|nr:hypothetical protein K440DRAFT_643414 [Wilcoxina mikolae CBS 423.85]
MHYTPDAYNAHNTLYVSLRNRIDKTESIRFSNNFLTTSATTDFQPTELCTEEYFTKRQKIIADGPGPLSDQAVNRIRATEEVQVEMINSGLSESLEQAEKFAQIHNLNKYLAAQVKDLEAAERIQDVNKELAAAHQEIEELEEELQIETRRSTSLERWLEKFNSDPKSTEHTTKHIAIAQYRLANDMLLQQVKCLSSEKSELQSELRVFERIIQRLTTNQGHVIPTTNISSELTPSSSGIRGSSELTSGPGSSGSRGFFIKSSNLPTSGNKCPLDDITAFLFALE